MLYADDRVSQNEILKLLTTALSNTASVSEDALKLLQEDRTASPAATQLVTSTGNLILAVASPFCRAIRMGATLTTLLAARHVFVEAVKGIVREGRLKVDFLDAVTIALILIHSSVASAALLLWIVDLGNALLEATSDSTRSLLAKSFGEEATTACLVADRGERWVKIDELGRGDRIRVVTGQLVPVDGFVESGDALLDQHLLTGESTPVEKSMGDRVFARTSVLAGQLIVQVEETGKATRAAQIISLIEASVSHKLQIQTRGERFAELMVLPTLFLGGVGRCLVSSDAMIAVINADYGTGIRVAAPLALLGHLAQAAKCGILVKDGRVLEAIGAVDAVVFDKTGTLTEPTPELVEIRSLRKELSDRDVLAFGACSQQQVDHPFARAIQAKARELGVEAPEAEASTYHLAEGIVTRINGETVRVGSRRFLARHGVRVPAAALARLEKLSSSQQHSEVLVSKGRKVIGRLGFHSIDRPEAQSAIDHLRYRRGIGKIFLLSGDREEITRATAKRLGITEFRAEMSPEEKARFIDKLKRQGLRVALVGDGINDSIALARADVSISLSGAADVAQDLADIVFLDGTLERLGNLFDLSDRLNRNVRSSFLLTFVPNTLCLVGALSGVVGVGSSLILNNAFNLIAAVYGASSYYREPPAIKASLASKKIIGEH